MQTDGFWPVGNGTISTNGTTYRWTDWPLSCHHIAGVTCPNCAPKKSAACPHCTPRCPHGYPVDAAPTVPAQPWITWTCATGEVKP